MIFRDATLNDMQDVVRLLADDIYGVTREQPAKLLNPRYAAGFNAVLAQVVG